MRKWLLISLRDLTMSRYEREDWDKFVEKIHLTLQAFLSSI
jgi:hypothetical protein